MEFSPQHDSRDEFEWEQALQDSDAYAARYFKLLRRFSDLPDADALIAAKLGKEFQDQTDPCDYDCPNCSQQWYCDFAFEDESGAPFDAGDFMAELMNEENAGSTDELQPGDTLFYETHPAFQMLQHCAFGWCNIYAAVLSPEGRRDGLRALYHLGRALANLASSIGDGLGENPNASIAFAKRSLAQTNKVLGEMKKMEADRPQYSQLLKAMRQHILKARSAVFDHLQGTRNRLE